jgi:hypothetical protein
MTPDVRASSARVTLLSMLGVAAIAAAAYLPVLGTGFSSDDFFILSRVRALNGLEHPLAYFQFGFFDYYRPVVFLSHALDWEMWGLNPFGYHLRSLLLHAVCSVLVLLIGRRLLSAPVAAIAATLFALHPASHEAVYWMAARFDLMATAFTLAALWCLSDDRPIWRGIGLLAFAIGLLSKESAISLVIVAPAWDVFVARRSFGSVIRRLLPLLVIVGMYAMVRMYGADLDAAGGGRRLPKAAMALMLMVAVLAHAWHHNRGAARPSPLLRVMRHRWLHPVLLVIVAGGIGLVLLAWPMTSAPVSRAIGFTAYVAFYFVSPVVFPSPPDWVFAPVAWPDALIGLLVVLTLAWIVLRFHRTIVQEASLLFLCVFIVAALLPVSSMTGGLRYLYLATAGVVLLAGWLLERVAPRARLAAAIGVTLLLAISLAQLMQAGRHWRAGSDMQRAGVLLMADAATPCGTRDVVMLTTPSGIGGVYANFLYEAFDVLADCPPKSFSTLLRVVGSDAHVDVTTAADGSIELRVPDYRGNILASADLSTFRERITPGRQLSLETAIGRLETYGAGSAQVFRIALEGHARIAAQFYYSDGAIHAAPVR